MISYWIFKVIYMPIFFILMVAASVVLVEIFKGTGWDVPFRWLCLIGMFAAFADWWVNK